MVNDINWNILHNIKNARNRLVVNWIQRCLGPLISYLLWDHSLYKHSFMKCHYNKVSWFVPIFHLSNLIFASTNTFHSQEVVLRRQRNTYISCGVKHPPPSHASPTIPVYLCTLLLHTEWAALLLLILYLQIYDICAPHRLQNKRKWL